MNRAHRLVLAFLTIGSLLLGASCKQTIDNLGIHLNLDKRTLSNGLTVIMVEDHTVPVVSYQTWYRVGSVDEFPGITGISHLFEHLMFKGTPKYGPKQFFLQLEAKGADVNAFTTRDYTVFYESFAPPLLEKVIDMESDRMTNLSITDEVLNTERLVVLEERRLRSENAPEGKIQEALWQLAYRRHPYHWPVIGFPNDLIKMTTAQLINYYKLHYHPSNAAIVVVGNFQADATFNLIKKYYEKIPKQKRPERDIFLEPEQAEERRLVIRDHVASDRFSQAYHITSATEDDSYALDVLASIMFEGKTSRAYRSLIDDKDLLITIYGTAFTPTYPGLFIVNAIMKGKVPSSQGETALEKVFDDIKEKGVTEEEVAMAVKQLTVQLVDSVRTPFGLGQLIGTVQMIFDEPKRFSEDLSKYTKVTPADVKRVALKYIHPNNRSVVTLTVAQ